MTAILVTGAAGFIGFHVAQRYLQEGRAVVGLDNLNDYYDPNLKLARLERLKSMPGFQFVRARPCGCRRAGGALWRGKVRGRRQSRRAGGGALFADQPAMPMCRAISSASPTPGHAAAITAAKHLVYASSSSVYGANRKLPFSVHQNVDHPLSLYAATKKANELMAHTYSHLFGLPTTGLRFFTVYGPWGRPDMALFLFTGRSSRAADRSVQPRPDAARFHLHRRHGRGRRTALTDHVRSPDPRWTAKPRPGHEHRALSALQHRQQPAGAVAAAHRVA